MILSNVEVRYAGPNKVKYFYIEILIEGKRYTVEVIDNGTPLDLLRQAFSNLKED